MRGQDLAVAQGQRHDYDARIGKPNAHEAYIKELAQLRNQLKLGLADRAPEGGTPVPVLAEMIRALRAGNTVEAAPMRVGRRKATRAEVPVTARIREWRFEKPEVVEESRVQVVAPVETPAVVIPMSELV
jgi:hypothetical protein